VVVTLPNGEELVFSTDPKEGEYPLSYGPTDEDGNAEFELQIPEGKLTDNTSGDLSVKQRDDAGNNSPALTYPVLVDTTPPGSIENLNIEGYNPDTDGLNTTTPTITGKGEAGQDVVVTLPNGEELVFSTDPKGDEYPLTYGPTDGNGNADFTLEIPEGKLTDNTSGDLSVKQRDDAGNDSPALTYPVIVDISAPENIEVFITSISDDSGVIDDFITNDKTLVISGTISRTLNTDERVEISIDGGNTWALVDLQGQNWSFENTNNLLLDGTFTAQVRVIDIANNVGAIYEQDITVDTVGPGNNAIEILAITPDTGIDGDFKTSTNTITVSGIIDNKLANDEIIKVTFDGGKTWKDAIVNNNTWSVELGPLADNNYTLQAQIFDIAGNPGAVDSQDLQIDGTEVGENTILIQSISDDSGAESDFITNDNTLIVNGTLDKPLGIGESIEIRINNENWIKVPAVNIINNNWVFTGFEDRILNDGDYIIDVRIVNIVGNTGSIDTKQITIDTVGPDINNKVYFDRISDDAGFADNDFKTNDTSLEFFGHLDKELEENEYVEISFDDGLTWNKTIVSGTEWYYDRQATPFENGTYKVKVRVIDYTGNLGYVTDSQDLVIDDSQIFQNSIVITDISDDKGVSNTDFVTNDNTLVLRGTIEETLESGQYIRLSLDGGNSWLRATVNPDGKSWILDLSQNTLGDGIYDLKAQIVNEFGTPEAEYVQSLTIDTAVTQTTISIDGISDDTNIDNDFNTADDTLIFYGSLSTSLDKDEFVQISLDGGLTWKLATVDGKNWTYDNTSQPLADKLDGYDVKVRVVDEAGNISGQDSQNVIINKAPPVGDVTVDPIATLDTTPTITGTFSGLRKGETVQVTIAGKVYSEINGNLTVNNSTGKWSLKIADADAINYSGRNNLELDVQAQIVTLSGAVKEDSSTDELTIYRAATVTKSPDFDYLADDTPAFVGRGNVGNGDVITVVIKNELGQTITTFTSNPGGGIEVDKLNSSWKITGNAWTSKGLSLDKGTYTITTSTSTLDGQGQQSGNTEEFTIFKPETTPAVTTVNRQDTASKVYAQPDGSYWLFYVTNSGANYNNDFNLYARKFNQKGEPISNQITIANSPYSDGHSLTDNLHFIYAYDVVFNDQGEFRVFYTSVNSQTPYIANFDKDGNRLSQGPTTNVQAFELDPTIVQMDNGDYVVFFASGTIHDYNLYMQRYKADGTAIDTTPVAQTTGVNAGNSFTFNLDGLVGAIQGSTNTSTTDGLNATHVSGDIYAVTYMSSKNRFDDGNTRDTDVWLRLYDFKTGKPLGEDVQVNVEDKFLQISPVVAYLADGTIVVTYLSNHTSTNGTAGNIQDFDIYSRRFKLDAENKLVALDDTDVRVNTTTDGVNGMLFDRVSTHYDMTALKHGGYVVTWSKFTAGNRAEVYSQAFDAAGNKLGGETLVSTNSSEFIDARPYVSALDDGGYVITWTKMADSNTNAWTNYTGDIYSVVVNADGSIRGQGDENVYPTNASYLDGTGALVGSDSVNTLDDKNGATSFDAGEGNDYIIISDSDFDFVDGNEGDDTLIWNSFEDLNLSDISGKVTSIEYIHMNDAYANTLTLNIEDVLAMTPENDHLLVIQGGEEDTVDLDLSNNEWSSLGAQTFRGETYNVFVHATEDAQLWIQQDIPVI
ncbi:Ig-like domain-containing protein, partial [Thorsellia kenyensis]